MKVFDVSVQHLVAIFEDFFLLTDFSVKDIKLGGTRTKFVAIPADHESKSGKNHGGSASHIAVHRKVFAVFHDVAENLLKETTVDVIIKEQFDGNPADRSRNTKQKTAGRKQS